MTSNILPPALSPQAKAHLIELYAELEEATAAHDGDAGVAVLRRIADEVHPDVARFIRDGLVKIGLANLAKRMGASDPEAYAILARLAAIATAN